MTELKVTSWHKNLVAIPHENLLTKQEGNWFSSCPPAWIAKKQSIFWRSLRSPHTFARKVQVSNRVGHSPKISLQS